MLKDILTIISDRLVPLGHSSAKFECGVDIQEFKKRGKLARKQLSNEIELYYKPYDRLKTFMAKKEQRLHQ